ncbi:MAG: response regulator [Bacteroidetes bacterium]|nr:response regulator [Bacteroidota bacterium]MBI3482486.1 response regulator [Bacteroidota bacterium]
MNTKKASILVVEDDKINQIVAKTLLHQWGMEATIANNGAEGVAQIASKAFHLVLMDIQMPVMDGFEATRLIRSMDETYFKTIPILAFTASGLVEVQKRADENGITDFIAKPLVLEELQSKIDKYISARHRPLFINFNLYTDGDPDFKKELITLLIDNVRELQQTLRSQAHNVSKIFHEVLHKVTSTVGMLCDKEFSETLEEIKMMCDSGQTGEVFHIKVNRFNNLCDQVVESLHAASFQ